MVNSLTAVIMDWSLTSFSPLKIRSLENGKDCKKVARTVAQVSDESPRGSAVHIFYSVAADTSTKTCVGMSLPELPNVDFYDGSGAPVAYNTAHCLLSF